MTQENISCLQAILRPSPPHLPQRILAFLSPSSLTSAAAHCVGRAHPPPVSLQHHHLLHKNEQIPWLFKKNHEIIPAVAHYHWVSPIILQEAAISNQAILFSNCRAWLGFRYSCDTSVTTVSIHADYPQHSLT